VQLYQEVLPKQVTVQTAVAGLSSREHKQLAYEMAICVYEVI
jgi:hypothetical protein